MQLRQDYISLQLYSLILPVTDNGQIMITPSLNHNDKYTGPIYN